VSEARAALPPLTRGGASALFAARRDVLRLRVVEVESLGVSVGVREVPARFRLDLEDALAARERFEAVPWHERVAFVLALTVVDPQTREPLLENPLDGADGGVISAADWVGELPSSAVVAIYVAACDVNRLGVAGVDASAGESAGEPDGVSSSDSPGN